MDGATLRQRFARSARVLVAVLGLAGLLSASAAGPESWKFDILRLKSGGTMTGILLDEDDDSLRFQIVSQRPGEKTRVTTTTKVQRDEVAKFDRLTEKDRDTLRKRLESLDPTGKGERARMYDLTLKQGAWIIPGQTAHCYVSEHFVLTSNADEEVVRRAALQLEDIYAAYARFLPARNKGKPTRIVLCRSLKEYQALLKGQGRNILNPAFFDSARNEIVCASDLEELGEGLAKVKKRHEEMLGKLKDQEADLRKQFGKQVPAPLIRPIRVKRQEIEQANKKNDAIFQLGTQHLFQTLYHEAFHAYLANFVYPPQANEVPRWLNEGLAQIFETAIVEAGELRVGHAEKERLEAIQTAVRKKQILSLPALLKSGTNDFLVANATARQASEQHYLNSWALAYYLTFERRLLGTPSLDRYVQALKRGQNETEAFRLMINQPLSQFEKDYQQYLLRLRADGTLLKKPR